MKDIAKDESENEAFRAEEFGLLALACKATGQPLDVLGVRVDYFKEFLTACSHYYRREILR